MADEFPFEDPKDLWQNQPSESSKMSTEIIRRMARDIEEKAKFEALVGVGGGLFLTFVLGKQLLQANEVTQRIGWAILIFWGAYGAFQSRRRFWPQRLETNATVADSLTFYRRELERRRDATKSLWSRTGVPVCLIGVAFVFGPMIARNPEVATRAIPFLALLAVWVVMLRKQRQKLQKDIEELDALQRNRQ